MVLRQPTFRPRLIRQEIRFVGLQRSGNHAIINWILRQADGPRAFFNNVSPEAPYSGRIIEGAADAEEIDLALYSLEDRLLPLLSKRHVYPRAPLAWRCEVRQRIDVLVLRDAFNLFASRFRSRTVSGNSTYFFSGLSLPQMYVMYADEFLDDSDYLPYGKVCVNFNRWASDVAYRRQLATRLGLSFDDAGREVVSSFGGGSSFEGVSHNGGASKMNTEDRWLAYADDPEFRAMFADPRIAEATRQIFGLDERLEDWIERCPRQSPMSLLFQRAMAPAFAHGVSALRGVSLFRKAYRTYQKRARARAPQDESSSR